MSKEQSRRYLLTIENPVEHGFDHEQIKKQFTFFSSLKYWCMCDEIGIENGTYHTHVFMWFNGGVPFKQVKKYFPSAHIDFCSGSSRDNYAYVKKNGKWAKHAKAEGNIPETFEESGEFPAERQGTRSDLVDLYDMVKAGYSNYDILSVMPQHMLDTDRIEKARQCIFEERYKKEFRKLNVVYIYGYPGTGKTRFVMEKFGYENVYRVTDYFHPFDTYSSQPVLLFDEFRSSLKIQDMLCYLDGYPIMLPARFSNRVACYTSVYIVSNLPLEKQFVNIQEEQILTWKAFLRRINSVFYFSHNGFHEMPVDENSCNDDVVVNPFTQEELKLD